MTKTKKTKRVKAAPKAPRPVVDNGIDPNDHFGLVYYLVNKLVCGQHADREDMEQTGMLGLLHAAKYWDPADPRSKEFSSYAGACIIGNAQTARADHARFRWLAPRWAMRAKYKDKHTNHLSLFSELGDSFVRGYNPLFARPDPAASDEKYRHLDNVACIAKHLTRLALRERDVLADRFGLEGREPMTLDALARKHNRTRQWVHQIEMRALVKLRCAVDKKHLPWPEWITDEIANQEARRQLREQTKEQAEEREYQRRRQAAIEQQRLQERAFADAQTAARIAARIAAERRVIVPKILDALIDAKVPVTAAAYIAGGHGIRMTAPRTVVDVFPDPNGVWVRCRCQAVSVIVPLARVGGVVADTLRAHICPPFAPEGPYAA